MACSPLTARPFTSTNRGELPEVFPDDWLVHWEQVADDEWHLKWELHERLREFAYAVKIERSLKLELWKGEEYDIGDALSFNTTIGSFASRHTTYHLPPNPPNSIVIYGAGSESDYNLGISSAEIGDRHLLIAYTGERGVKMLDDYTERKCKEEEERQRKKEEAEREEIKRKIKERHRRQELEKIIRQELIDSGELYGDQPKRPPIPREVVDAIYRRDGGKCVYCGSTQNLQLDHIIPFSRGGATTIENLQLLCQKCNLEKSNKIG